MRTDVQDCPRCGGNHKRLKPKMLKRPSRFTRIKIVAWMTCPVTREPILLTHWPFKV